MNLLIFMASAIISALFTNAGEGFIPVKDNVKLQALLAQHPKLDIYETAAVGTPQELEAMLKEDPAAVTKPNGFGWTLLHLAAFAGNVENAELLIAKGANIEARAKSKFRNTPLQAALLS